MHKISYYKPKSLQNMTLRNFCSFTIEVTMLHSQKFIFYCDFGFHDEYLMYNLGFKKVNMATTKKNGLVDTLKERCKATTPPFFRKLRIVGLILVAAGSAVVATPIAFPALVVSIAGYIVVAGSVVTTVSQLAVPEASVKTSKKPLKQKSQSNPE